MVELKGSHQINRRNFAKLKTKLQIPSLIEIQRRSYERFLQADIDPQKRQDVGLQAAFKTVFPVKSYNEMVSLEYASSYLLFGVCR